VAVAAEREVRRARTRRMAAVTLGVALALWAGIALLLDRVGGLATSEAFLVSGAGIGISLLVALPFLLLLAAARKPENRWYKRLRPGRQLGGVCLGLAEHFHWNATYVRLAFVAAFFVLHGFALFVYVALYIAMPLHPDDRRHLLRFRLRRWWERRSGGAASHAG
jgi:phage shock protein C